MSDPDRPSVVVICGDPGGASAMAPVVERLLADGRVSARPFAYREAQRIWGRAGLPFEEISETTSVDRAAEVLLNNQAVGLAVGTSVNPVGLEKLFVQAAARAGTPSLALLDFWSSYVNRFSDGEGRLAHLPDVIAVMDEGAKREMVEAGFDPARLVVTGQPAFDALPSIRRDFGNSARRSIRRALGAAPGSLLVAFVSQPLSTVFGSTSVDPGYLGFTERDVLASLLAALGKLGQQGVRVVLAVLPHPREVPEAYEHLEATTVATVVAHGHSPRQVVMAADLVVGMSSILLIEACYLGCPTVSLQPGLRQADTLPTNRLGVSRAVYDAADIDSEIADLLLNEHSRRALLERLAHFRPAEVAAAERVAGLIYTMVEGGIISRATAPQRS